MSWKAVSAFLGVALIAAVVALGVVMSSGEDRAAQRAEAGAEADAAARKAVVALTTYDWSSVEEDFAWVDDAGTEKFRRYYAEVSEPIRTAVTELKVHAEGTVVDSAPRVIDENRVVVLLFVDQTISDEQEKDNQLDQPRITMTMVRQDGRWLVDEVAINNLTAS